MMDITRLPGRPLAGLAVLVLLGLLLLLDTAQSQPINPYAAPPPVALGSGEPPSGAHCSNL